MSSSGLKVVALINPKGQVGSAVLEYLLPAAESEQIHLVVLHRPESDVSSLKAHQVVETRSLNLTDPVETNKAKLQDVNVLISALPGPALPDQTKIIDALKGSTNISLFIASDYGTYWDKEELELGNLGFLKVKEDVYDYAVENKIPVAFMKGGVFPSNFAIPGEMLGVNLKENKVAVYKGSLHTKLPITSPTYFGAATAAAAIQVVKSGFNGKDFLALEVLATGQNIIDALQEIHGQKPQVSTFTQEMWDKELAVPGFPAFAAVLKQKWADDNFGFKDAVPVEVNRPKDSIVSIFKQLM